jgi:hypothetical protein
LKITKQSIKENLFLFAVFIGLLLPLRLLFQQYLSHYWIGTLGIFSLVIFLLFYFSNKGKLGNIGRILIKKITSKTKGKLGKSFIIGSIFVIYLSTLSILGSTYADPNDVKLVTDALHKEGVHDMKTMINRPLPSPTPIQLVMSIIITVTPNPISFAMFHSVNDISDGWMQSLFSIILIEEIEVLGIVLFLRYRNKVKLDA